MPTRPAFRFVRFGFLPCVLLLTLAVASTAAASSLTVQLEPRADGLSGRLVLRATPAGDLDPATARPAVEQSAELGADGAHVTLDLAAAPAWDLDLEGAGLWAPPVRGLSAGRDVHLTLPVWPASSLAVRFHAEDGEALPPVVEVTVFDAAPANPAVTSSAGRPASVVSCPLAEDGRLAACPLPAGRRDLRLKVAGFTAVHRWGERLAAGETHDLGDVELRRGASLLGRVLTAGGPPDVEQTRVWLVPAGRGGAELDRVDEQALATAPDDDGWFHFDALPLGRYALRVDHPSYLPSGRLSVVVREAHDLELAEPVRLTPAARLSIRVVPASDPWGEPWTIGMQLEEPAATRAHGADVGTTDELGEWRSQGVSPGTYRFEIESSRGDRYAFEEGVVLEPGINPLWYELPVVAVAGSMSLGDEPLAGDLWFGGRSAPLSVRARADADGLFFAFVPHEGEWELEVAADEPTVRTTVGVEVVAADGLATLDVELPASGVEVRVEDVRGGAAAGARVSLMATGRRGLAVLNADAEGEAVFHGVAAGDYWLEASDGARRSAAEKVTVDEDSVPSRRVVLRDDRTLVGRVTAAGGPVPSAMVLATPFASDGRLLNLLQRPQISDAEGVFQLAVPDATERLSLQVMPLGFGFTSLSVPSGADIEVAVAPADGSLVVEALDALPPGEVGMVLIDDEVVTLPVLLRWASMNGASVSDPQRVEIPALPAGDYRLCRASVDEAMLVAGGMALPRHCRGGRVTPGGTLVLALPPATAVGDLR